MDRPAFLYHTTLASNLKSIKRHGLSPSMARRSAYVFLAAGEGQSAAYEAWYPGKKVVLLRIDVSKLDEGLLGPDDMDLPDILDQRGDDRHFEDVGWLESLELSGQATYKGVIAPAAIKALAIWKSPSY